MSNEVHPPVPNTRQAVDFLHRLFPSQPRHLVALNPEGAPPEAKTFLPSAAATMAAWIEARQGKSNVYYHVNELLDDVRDRKAKKGDVVRSQFLHVDVDVLDEGTLERIRTFVPAPTFIMSSGGGFQVGWKLAQPTTDLEGVERANKSLAAALGGDNCHNIDRIMRVPGTTNLPNAKKRAAGRVPVVAQMIDENWDRSYALADFPKAELEPDPVKPAAVAAVVTKASHIVPVNVDDLPGTVLDETREIIRLGDDPERPRGGEAPRFKSRSEGAFKVAVDLAKAGCSEEQIAGILVNSAFGISASILEKKYPKTYALKQARAALAAVANGWPDPDGKGLPRATMRNALLALRRLELAFSFDIFRHQKMVGGNALEEQGGEISDDMCSLLRKFVIENFDFDPKAENVRDAVNQLCLENAFHPIRQMLRGLVWDGTPRLDRLLPTYFGADDTPLNLAIGPLTLIAAVRRVEDPGVKFDTIVVLEGAQGTGKSTALQILAGPGNHSDNEILTLDTKGQMEAMAGVWIYELSELSGLRKAEVEKVKAFASRSDDRARMAYGHYTETRKRQCIFVATTNEEKYLRDLTGNRRFLPVKTGAIDLAALRRDRDQLLAEAAHREAESESIALPEELWGAAAVEQAERLEDDPWAEKLASVNGKAFGEEVRVFSHELIAVDLGLPLERQHNGHTKRVAGIMRALGWEPAKFKIHGKTVRGFRRPKPDDHEDDDRF